MTDLALLRADFNAFRSECVWCSIVYNTHQNLFEADKEQSELLRKSAGWFFYDYSIISQEAFFLIASRLTDPATQGRNSNLTVAHFVNALADLDKLTDEITEKAADLESFRHQIATSRSKLIAHRDLVTVRSNEPLKSFPIGAADAFIPNLVEFCDLVAEAIGSKPLDFQTTPSEGDAIDLVRLLRRALKDD